MNFTHVHIKEHFAREMLFLDCYFDLGAMFRKRVRGWPKKFPGSDRQIELLAIWYMRAPMCHIDERQYEVFKLGDILRGAEREALDPHQDMEWAIWL